MYTDISSIWANFSQLLLDVSSEFKTKIEGHIQEICDERSKLYDHYLSLVILQLEHAAKVCEFEIF